MLARQTGREDVVFGATVSGRPPELEGVERMLGLFINTLPVRVRLRPEESVIALLDPAAGGAVGADPAPPLRPVRHPAHTGFGTLRHQHGRRELPPGPGPSSTLSSATSNSWPSASTTPPTIRVPRRHTRPRSRSHLKVSYRLDVYTRDEAQRINGRLVHLLETLVTDPEQRIGAVDVCPPRSASSSCRCGSGGGRRLRWSGCVHERFRGACRGVSGCGGGGLR
ncbi:condensation domain-containing protein [Streptomyces sp. Marseille-Q5077]|uniref:condensation domain-containing protein n=1 Tax=Streptomyces sp. Marseille-Q5077 TaxID=3418995 RepID=UPI003CFC201F